MDPSSRLRPQLPALLAVLATGGGAYLLIIGGQLVPGAALVALGAAAGAWTALLVRRTAGDAARGDADVEGEDGHDDAADAESRLAEALSLTITDVARRDLALTTRLLDRLEAMQRDEADAGRLHQLYALDHLAVRLRGHAENLLVVAGAGTSGDPDEPPMRVVDLIRLAASQAEDYARVRIEGPAPAAVAGWAARPVAQLLAALLDNGLRYSPPGQPVVVTAQEVAEGVSLAVRDHGIGMDDLALAAARRTLQDPPQVHATRSQQLGLHVVGVLAQRLGLEVALDRAADGAGGIVATVSLPAGLLVEVPAAAAPAAGRHLTAVPDVAPAAPTAAPELRDAAPARADAAPRADAATTDRGDAAPAPRPDGGDALQPPRRLPPAAAIVADLLSRTEAAPPPEPVADLPTASPVQPAEPATPAQPATPAAVADAPAAGTSPTGTGPTGTSATGTSATVHDHVDDLIARAANRPTASSTDQAPATAQIPPAGQGEAPTPTLPAEHAPTPASPPADAPAASEGGLPEVPSAARAELDALLGGLGGGPAAPASPRSAAPGTAAPAAGEIPPAARPALPTRGVAPSHSADAPGSAGRPASTDAPAYPDTPAHPGTPTPADASTRTSAPADEPHRDATNPDAAHAAAPVPSALDLPALARLVDQLPADAADTPAAEGAPQPDATPDARPRRGLRGRRRKQEQIGWTTTMPGAPAPPAPSTAPAERVAAFVSDPEEAAVRPSAESAPPDAPAVVAGPAPLAGRPVFAAPAPAPDVLPAAAEPADHIPDLVDNPLLDVLPDHPTAHRSPVLPGTGVASGVHLPEVLDGIRVGGGAAADRTTPPLPTRDPVAAAEDLPLTRLFAHLAEPTPADDIADHDNLAGLVAADPRGRA